METKNIVSVIIVLAVLVVIGWLLVSKKDMATIEAQPPVVETVAPVAPVAEVKPVAETVAPATE